MTPRRAFLLFGISLLIALAAVWVVSESRLLGMWFHIPGSHIVGEAGIFRGDVVISWMKGVAGGFRFYTTAASDVSMRAQPNAFGSFGRFDEGSPMAATYIQVPIWMIGLALMAPAFMLMAWSERRQRNSMLASMPSS